MWWYILIAVGAIFCAIQAIRAERLLASALWLAGTSALVAVAIYLLGAPEVAAIELSVGAGLVTVLFVFAINLIGKEAVDERSLIPKPLAWVLISLAVACLIYLLLPGIVTKFPEKIEPGLRGVLWGTRRLDLWLQIAMIFSGVLGVLGLLGDSQEDLSVPSQETKE
jgi:NADH:ubiquinone oxidoreductase subunit 6 (subunit J)